MPELIQELTKGVNWIGAVDWNVRNFHGYRTGLGTTYNAYIVCNLSDLAYKG